MLNEDGIPIGYLIWHPTNELRWIKCIDEHMEYPYIKSNRFKYKLQQKWFCEYRGYGSEWRDVPVVTNVD